MAVAIAAFVLLVMVVAWIMLPVKAWFALDANVIVSWTDEHGADPDQQRKSLAESLARHYNTNAKRIRRRQIAFTIAIAALVIELCALVIDLWRG